MGSGFDRDSQGPASIAFIEGSLVQLSGNSSQALADLDSIANSMKRCC